MSASPPTFSKRRTIARFLSFTARHPRVLLLALLFTVISTVATVLGPRIFGFLVDDALVPHDKHMLLLIVGLFLASELVRLVTSIFHSYFFQVLGQRTLHDIRTTVFEHVLRLQPAILDRSTSGMLSTRLVSDVGALAALFSAGFVRIFERIVTVAVIAVGLLALHVQLGAICLGLLLAFSVFSVFLTRHLYAAYGQIRVLLAELNSFLTENLAGLRIIHLYNRERIQTTKFKELSAGLADARLRPALLFGVLHATMTIIVGACMFTLIAFGGHMVADATLSIGTLLTLISYVVWLFWPIMQIVNEWNTFLAGVAAASRVFELLDWAGEEHQDKSEMSHRAPLIRGEIEFKNVSFRYGERDWALQNISFKVRSGERVAFCGPTGAGKSTILALLMRFYEPTEGEILLDGRPIQSLKLHDLRTQIGLVQQDVFLFSGTLEENVTLWSDSVSSAELHDDRVAFQKRGAELTQEIAERGSNLSTGERQYIAFLRTVLRKPALWLVDEATAYLDPNLDRELMTRLRETAGGNTILTVAHRLASIVDYDKIFVLHRGQILERGSHSELLQAGGLYEKLFRLQAAKTFPVERVASASP